MLDTLDSVSIRGRSAWGWAFVVAQGLLLALVVGLPSSDHWNVPGWLSILGWTFVLGGVVLVAVAAGALGSALTPTPVPREGTELVTGGLYGWVRHPIYSGVLLAVFGIAIRSGQVLTVLTGMATLGFFWVKSSYEERWLRAAHPGYDEYARRVPRLVPRIDRSEA